MTTGIRYLAVRFKGLGASLDTTAIRDLAMRGKV